MVKGKKGRKMCLAIPALVKSIDGSEAEAEIGGISRRISILLTPEVEVGDYVLLHTGYAINVIDEEEAKETLKLFEEMASLDEPEG
jgi:hydrogenase expression/formation protein HypC